MSSNGKSFSGNFNGNDSVFFGKRLRYFLYRFGIDGSFRIVKIDKRNVQLPRKNLTELYVGNVSKLDNVVSEILTGSVLLLFLSRTF